MPICFLMSEILSQHHDLSGVLILDKMFDPVISSVSILISFIHPMEGFRMSYYVSGSKMSYGDYLTGKSFVADMTSATQSAGKSVTMALSRQTREVIASNEALARD